MKTLDDPALSKLADMLDDLEGERKATANRVRILTAATPDEDGVMRGFALSADDPSVRTMEALNEGLSKLEHEAVLQLQRVMRKHPLGAWQRAQKGVGEKTLARLLGAIGDPYIRRDDGQPRTVHQLWALCGLHVIEGRAAKRAKGVQCNWSTTAKTRAYLISEAIVKAGVRTAEDGSKIALSPYAQAYLDRRAHTALTHPEASAADERKGLGWTKAHAHADAMRIVSKTFLKALWREAKRLHEEEGGDDGSLLLVIDGVKDSDFAALESETSLASA